jgi:lysophospholipase L1-like esterase
VHSYGWYLRRYVADIKARGATPSSARRSRAKAGTRTARSSAAPIRMPAGPRRSRAQQQIGFIDLNESVASQYDALGRDAVMQLFPLVTPDEHTHTNMAGAELNARAVVAGLKALGDAALSSYSAAGAAIPKAQDDRPVVDASKVAGDKPRNPALPSLFLVGDSTVKSGGVNGAIGWGERIAPYFDTDKINVVNHAIGGRSSRTFFTEGRWDKVLAQLKARRCGGDPVRPQRRRPHRRSGREESRFGAGHRPETVEDTRPDASKEQVHSFGWYMARYVPMRAPGAPP